MTETVATARVASYATGEIFAVRVLKSPLCYYVERIGDDTDTLEHNQKLESRLNTETTDMYKSIGRSTKINALAVFGLIWYATNKEANG